MEFFSDSLNSTLCSQYSLFEAFHVQKCDLELTENSG